MTAVLAASIEDVEGRCAELQGRRDGLREELAGARKDVAAAREARAAGTGSTEALAGAHSRAEALAAALGEAEEQLTAAHAELADLRRESGQGASRRRLAELAGQAETLFEEWSEAYRAFGAALSRLPRRILDLEAELADLQREFTERAEALWPGFRRGAAGSVDLEGLELGPLAGYREPGMNLARPWVRGDTSELGRLARRPERPDLGAVDKPAQELIAIERERRA